MEAARAQVFLADTKPGLAGAVRAVFEHFGGGAALLRSSRDVYLKVNAVGDKPHSYTDPEVLRATIRYFQRCGARTVYVIENCTQASFTRVVFHSIGFTQLCQETGAIPVYLDETGAVPELGLAQLREIVHPPFRIVYRLDEERVRVVRVWRSERLPRVP